MSPAHVSPGDPPTPGETAPEVDGVGFPDPVDRSGAVAIVGAGPAGLSIARLLRKYGVDYDHFERHSAVGGLWDLDNPGTPMYESAHLVSSREMSGFVDFPMPRRFGDHPSRAQVLAYTRAFAAEFGLDRRIEFGTAVASVAPLISGEWLVTPAGGTPRRYRGVVCASGANWHPRTPTHRGEFTGVVRHAVTHRRAGDFAGRRILVVGLGNSGADIACDAAQTADAVFVSVRRGYHVVPKHLLGVPADTVAAAVAALPRRVGLPLAGLLLRLLVGDVTRWGLRRPDHRPFESHPLVSGALLHHLQQGDIAVKADVERFDGADVVFTDGSRERVDEVIYATGYRMPIPYADETLFAWNGDRPDQYLTAFNRRHRNLFTLGFLEVNAGAFPLFDEVANLIAQYLHDQVLDPARAARFDRLIRDDHPDLSGGLALVDSARHAGYVDATSFTRTLARVRHQIGWSPLAPGATARLRAPRRPAAD